MGEYSAEGRGGDREVLVGGPQTNIALTVLALAVEVKGLVHAYHRKTLDRRYHLKMD